MELVFNCQNYSEEKKVRLAATEFSGYVIHWRDPTVTSRRKIGEPQLASRFELKTIMKICSWILPVFNHSISPF